MKRLIRHIKMSILSATNSFLKKNTSGQRCTPAHFERPNDLSFFERLDWLYQLDYMMITSKDSYSVKCASQSLGKFMRQSSITGLYFVTRLLN